MHALPRFKGLVVRMGPPAGLRPELPVDEELSASIARKMSREDGKGSRRLRGSMGELGTGECALLIWWTKLCNDFTLVRVLKLAEALSEGDRC
jgi:hypothetical protein